jgi:hypothetical protein
MRAWMTLVLVLAVQAAGGPASAQDPDAMVALGVVGPINPQVFLTWDDQIPRYDEDRIRDFVQTRFQRELAGAGIPVTEDEEKRLALYLNPVFYDGLVTYTWRLSLEERAVPTRTLREALIPLLPSYEAAVDTASSPAAARSQLLATAEAGAVWATTWEGSSGLGWLRPQELRGILEARAQDAALEFVEVWSAGR